MLMEIFQLNIVKTILNNKEVAYQIILNKDYELLIEQYLDALKQASETKGKERHANGLPFEKQKICRINRDVGVGFGLGQCIKKVEESKRLIPSAAIHELYGAINYLCGVII